MFFQSHRRTRSGLERRCRSHSNDIFIWISRDSPTPGFVLFYYLQTNYEIWKVKAMKKSNSPPKGWVQNSKQLKSVHQTSKYHSLRVVEQSRCCLNARRSAWAMKVDLPVYTLPYEVESALIGKKVFHFYVTLPMQPYQQFSRTGFLCSIRAQ